MRPVTLTQYVAAPRSSAPPEPDAAGAPTRAAPPPLPTVTVRFRSYANAENRGYGEPTPAQLGDAGTYRKNTRMTIPAPAPADTAPAPAKQKNTVGLVALIVGGVAFICAVIPVLSFIAWAPAIAAIVLGIIGLVKKNRTRGLAWAGLALGVVAWIVAIAVSIATLAGAASSISQSIESSAPIAASPAPAITEEAAVAETPVETTAPVQSAAPAPAAPELTMGQRNAVAKAKDYLSLTAFSRSGLAKQLEFEGFATADAEFAVDNISADWNVQAEKKAKEYLDLTSFSRDSLIQQLTFEGFTQEQAEHGATAAGY